MNSQHFSDEALTQLVNGENYEEHQYAHLEGCKTCQDRLAKTTAGPWWWDEGQEWVSSSIEMMDATCSAHGSAETGTQFDPTNAEIQALVDHFDTAIHPELLGQVDEFEVYSLLGVGGMGAVFKGMDRELNRHVAIKFLLPRHARSGLSRQRFSREATAVAAVRDDNVIPVFRINSTAKYPYFVMPLITGDNLEQHIVTEGALDACEIVQIAGQIAAGLAAAHDQGLIHRDIKPANILLENSRNRVIVTDFGLAREEDDLSLTQTGMIAGTPKYMSPEQADGRPLDQRSDLFSLGAVMFWMATGKAPFNGTGQLDLLKNIREKKHRSVRSLNPTIPSKLAQTIDLLLEKKPIDRFQSATETQQFLARYSAHLRSPDQNNEPKLNRRRIRAWQIALASLGVFLCFAMLTIFAFLNSNGPKDNSNQRESDSAIASSQQPFINSIGMKLNLIPAGDFLMGSDKSDRPEEYQHAVKITRPFYIGVFEVTHGQFQQFVDETGYVTEAEKPEGGASGIGFRTKFGRRGPRMSWKFIGGAYEPTVDHPVMNVTWNDAVAFCKWLSKKAGKTYRLPTEAEWEYACRGKTSSPFSFGDANPDLLHAIRLDQAGSDSIETPIPHPTGTYTTESKTVPLPVGSFSPNPYGLYDMHGNLAEWCLDWYDIVYYKHSSASDAQGPAQGTTRVLRGGSYQNIADQCRSAARGNDLPSHAHHFNGFRVVLEK